MLFLLQKWLSLSLLNLFLEPSHKCLYINITLKSPVLFTRSSYNVQRFSYRVKMEVNKFKLRGVQDLFLEMETIIFFFFISFTMNGLLVSTEQSPWHFLFRSWLLTSCDSSIKRIFYAFHAAAPIMLLHPVHLHHLSFFPD